MIYPIEFEQKIGFDQIRKRLQSYCLSPLGLKRVDAISFHTDFADIQRLLKQNAEFNQILLQGEEFPGTNYFDPEECFQVASREGSFLEEETFHQLIVSLQAINGCKKFIVNRKDSFPELFQLTIAVDVPAHLVKALESKFDDQGKIKDNATVELARLRKRLREEQHRVRRLVEQSYARAAEQGWVPDGSGATIRDGRLVIPIQAEHKRKLSGIIVDESSTGQTVYMEPADVLEANNEIRDLFHAERREIVKILKELTQLIHDNLIYLRPAYEFLGWIDFTRARARFSLDIQAELPELKAQPGLDWVQARHPLLFLSFKGKREVVPLTINLSTEQPFLLISGPNAGGKSVCLKTVGLIQYMAQCGLLVPLQDRSQVGIFEHIFLDIGDQQSIENDLSTYSSHLKNMAHFVGHANPNSLILLDELGTGTDPNFGGGIAEAILGELLDKGAWGVATTHYYNLKLFASNHARIRNGSMQFDTSKLEPLFRLEIGKPGSSFALEIARKTGLSNSTIHKAEAIIGQELTGLETLMKKVADEKLSLEVRIKEVEAKEKKLKEQLSKYDSLTTELNDRKKEIIDKAKTEASNLLKQTNREIEKTIRHIRENKAEKKETRKVREGLKDLGEKVSLVSKPAKHEVEQIEVGDSVRLRGQEVSGKVISIKENTALVQFGDLYSQVKVNQLVRSDKVSAQEGQAPKSKSMNLLSKQTTFVNTLDIRGKRVEEVNTMLEQFLDDAILLGHGEVKILHGKGEGVLRTVVRDQLKKNRSVASFADEHVDRGGAGITVVILK